MGIHRKVVCETLVFIFHFPRIFALSCIVFLYLCRLLLLMYDASDIGLLVFDWSGVISDDRMPVYEANMRILEDYGKPTISFEEWLPRTTMTPVEFLKNHGVFGDDKKMFALYKKYFDEA